MRFSIATPPAIPGFSDSFNYDMDASGLQPQTRGFNRFALLPPGYPPLLRQLQGRIIIKNEDGPVKGVSIYVRQLFY